MNPTDGYSLSTWEMGVTEKLLWAESGRLIQEDMFSKTQYIL